LKHFGWCSGWDTSCPEAPELRQVVATWLTQTQDHSISERQIWRNHFFKIRLLLFWSQKVIWFEIEMKIIFSRVWTTHNASRKEGFLRRKKAVKLTPRQTIVQPKSQFN
jgi:hypothetical protein